MQPGGKAVRILRTGRVFGLSPIGPGGMDGGEGVAISESITDAAERVRVRVSAFHNAKDVLND